MDAKITSIVSYISWIGWLVAFFAGDKESELSKQHLNQSLIIMIISIIPIGITQIFAIVFAIMGIIKAINEDATPLPLIGGIHLIK